MYAYEIHEYELYSSRSNGRLDKVNAMDKLSMFGCSRRASRFLGVWAMCVFWSAVEHVGWVFER